MKKCLYCGKVYSDDWALCQECGRELVDSANEKKQNEEKQKSNDWLNMEEKVLAESKQHRFVYPFLVGTKAFSIIIVLILCIIALVMLMDSDEEIALCLFGAAAIVICIAFLMYKYLANCHLTITTRRAYGKAAFGKRVDLPIDSISAVGTSWLYGIDIGTSSGRIHFKCLGNHEEIHKVISNLLMERQQKDSQVTKNIVSSSNADELKKYKELLDSGIITQEEFDAKKKQLLNL